ncbi:hypothetical protein [Rhizorhapis sp. SPR117]|uniref:hypothetical protein n=1 Tax=Rhizorhapis sp. SPR117 TaxID=2912611 RepID=UPI001F2B5419|nr:hypothetical protein [Rhizorhapis sp. SPR117]
MQNVTTARQVDASRSRRLSLVGGLAAVLLIIAPEAAHADKTGNTVLGVGIGAPGGALISGGDTRGTIGGAVAGGVSGNIASKDKKHRWDRRDRRDDRRWERDRYERREHRRRR